MKDTVVLSLETIGRDSAKQYLDRSDGNRRTKSDQVHKISDDMQKNRWLVHTGECIKFDRNGRLIDGHHRLLAVIDSGATVQMYVARGCDPDAMGIIDSAVPRSPTDRAILTHRIKEKIGVDNPRLINYSLRIAKMYLQATKEGVNWASHKFDISDAAAMSFLEDNFAAIQSAATACSSCSSFLSVHYAAGTYLLLVCGGADPAEVGEFFSSFGSGVGANAAAIQLRQFLVTVVPERTRMYGNYYLRLFAKAWNSHKRNQVPSLTMQDCKTYREPFVGIQEEVALAVAS